MGEGASTEHVEHDPEVGVEIGVNALGSAFLFSSVSVDTELYWDCLVPT